MRINLISDFDGIWTNQNIEADYVWDYIINTLTELTGFDSVRVQKILDECKVEMNKEAHRYGWFNTGNIAAYYKEDPFGDNNAIFDYINKSVDSTTDLKKLKEVILDKFPSLAEFSQDCFVNSTTKFKEDGKLIPVDTMKKVVDKLNSNGVKIIVVSNSKTEKIKYLFAKADIEVTDEDSSDRGGVHAIGDARKYIIDSDYSVLPEYLKINSEYKIPLRRSNYHKILQGEKPDYVIGDVFSLDLALPLYLRMNDNSFSNLKVIQRVQPYTPDWVKDFLSKDEFKEISYLVNNVDEVPELIARIRN